MHGGAGTNGCSGGTIPEMGAEGGPALCYCISCWDGRHTFGEAGREGSETAVWKTVTGTFRDLSPVVIVAEVDNSGDSGTGGSSGSGSGSSSGSSSSDGTAQSPKTGVASDWMTWLSAAVVLGTAAVLVRKTKKVSR